jgi:hypothetical protein
MAGAPGPDFRTRDFQESRLCRQFQGYPFLDMVFRTKIEKTEWIVGGLWAFVVASMIAMDVDIYRMHRFTAKDASFLGSWIMILLMNVVPPLFNRLKIDANYLRYRAGFWTTKVALTDVTLVRNYGITTGQLVIEFSPHLSKADPKSIVVDPKDRIGFLSAMRQFAPQATFE